MMAKVILSDPTKCQACKRCELQCAVEKSKGRTLLAAIAERSRPRVRVIGNRESIPNICRHCESICISNCPTEAIERKKEGIVVVDEEKCIKCLLCTAVCPFDVLKVFEETVTKCDLCYSRLLEGKIPMCVESCPSSSALKFEPLEAPVDRKFILSEKFVFPPRRYDLAVSASEIPVQIIDRIRNIQKLARPSEVTTRAKKTRRNLGLPELPLDGIEELNKVLAATKLSKKIEEVKAWRPA